MHGTARVAVGGVLAHALSRGNRGVARTLAESSGRGAAEAARRKLIRSVRFLAVVQPCGLVERRGAPVQPAGTGSDARILAEKSSASPAARAASLICERRRSSSNPRLVSINPALYK